MKLSLYLPTSNYPYKRNHFLFDLPDGLLEGLDIDIFVTLPRPITPIPRITFLGETSTSMSKDMFVSCHGILSFSALESYGLPALEACFYKKPFLGPNVIWLEELLGRSYYRFEFNYHAFANALSSFAEDLRGDKAMVASLSKPLINFDDLSSFLHALFVDDLML